MEYERQRVYDRKKGIAIGIQQGIVQGVEQGSLQKAFETTKKLFEMNLGNEEQISKVTGFLLSNF